MRLTVSYGPGVAFVPWGDEGLVLPDRFSARFDEEGRPATVELDVAVEDGDLRCIRLVCTARSGEYVTGDLTRALPVSLYLRQAGAAAAIRATTDDAGVVSLEPIGGPTGTVHLEDSLVAHHRRITPQFLDEVARIYTEDTTGAPTKAVAEHFQTSRQNAGKWVKAARDGGHLREVKR